MVALENLYDDYPSVPRSIMLVEDNVVNQIVTKQLLNRWGYTVTIANHGREALELIKHQNFSAVIMDIQMPEMDGFETTKKIRGMSDNYYKTVPILAYSASSLTDSKEKALKHGMNDYIGKPLNPQEMQDKLNLYVMKTPAPRKLNINFQLYTDGEQDFKVQLVTLMIENMRELKQGSVNAKDMKNVEVFRRTVHKINPTLIILEDAEFNELIEDMKRIFITINDGFVVEDKVHEFGIFCESIIVALQKELERI